MEPVVNKIFQCDKSYNEIISSAHPLSIFDLQHVTELDTLRMIIVELKRRELAWDIKYHQLDNAVDAIVGGGDEIGLIYQHIEDNK